MSKYDYTGGVVIIHYSDVSINDANCIVKYTTDKKDKPFSNALAASWFRSRNRLVEFYGNISNVYISSFMFASCSALSRLRIDGKDAVNDGEYAGTWTHACSLNHMFRYIKLIKKQHIQFPNLIHANGNFYSTGVTDVDSNYQSVVRMQAEYANCTQLERVNFEGGLKNLVIGQSTFRKCSKLTSFEYDLPRLLTGIGMFEGCKLNKASVERILYSLPNIANIRKCTSNADITAGVKVGNDTYRYWGSYKEGDNRINVVHDEKKTGETPTEKTTQLIGRVYNNASSNSITVHFKMCRRVPASTGGSVLGWYWKSASISQSDLGVLHIGMAQGVEAQVTKALNDAKSRGWNIIIG